MQIVQLPYLKAGEETGVLNTSNITKKGGIHKQVTILKEWNLVPVKGKSIDPHQGSFAAGTARGFQGWACAVLLQRIFTPAMSVGVMLDPRYKSVNRNPN
ncbi:hypothetical protein C8N40_109126 [Pontibacter mucosus]|uniref:Uncharacterized protein n=1 Tax=Pontibacter mucosus TaxID=1649266 RepID=A0A2T5YE86_9BACT|nr:hypothetical protein [Pontibacter mucosus]PTX15028.1 hypothetical protein C8N40_109126 [Pontibacter mucosus]